MLGNGDVKIAAVTLRDHCRNMKVSKGSAHAAH
jgi:hypothetical protein